MTMRKQPALRPLPGKTHRHFQAHAFCRIATQPDTEQGVILEYLPRLLPLHPAPGTETTGQHAIDAGADIAQRQAEPEQ
ncbi:hypothetical protein D3C85_1655120 [compost metagenome]